MIKCYTVYSYAKPAVHHVLHRAVGHIARHAVHHAAGAVIITVVCVTVLPWLVPTHAPRRPVFAAPPAAIAPLPAGWVPGEVWIPRADVPRDVQGRVTRAVQLAPPAEVSTPVPEPSGALLLLAGLGALGAVRKLA